MLDDQRPRRVVPRWRSSWVTATTAEARSRRKVIPSSETQHKVEQEVAAKAREFDVSKSTPVAAELMFIASMAGNQIVAEQAAKAILACADQIGSTQLVRSARLVVENMSTDRNYATANDFIRRARSLLAIDYANPVLLIDTARELTAMRKERAALRYIRAAVALV